VRIGQRVWLYNAQWQRAHGTAGAELVVDYRTDDVLARVRRWAPSGVARIVEVDLLRNIGVDAQLLAPAGTISTYAGATGAIDLPRALFTSNARLEFVLVYTIPDEARRAAVTEIAQAIGAGALTLLPIHRFPLGEVAAAHNAVEAGAVGKVLVDIP
jgi:NADPH2:quinone reductase